MIDTSYRPRPKPSYRVRRWTELEARQVERRERAFGACSVTIDRQKRERKWHDLN